MATYIRTCKNCNESRNISKSMSYLIETGRSTGLCKKCWHKLHGKKQSSTHTNSFRPYRIWAGMKARCNDTNSKIYKYYGGKGIIYDKRWETFDGFWDDMQLGYGEKLSLDRIDNSKNYCKENCRWATKHQQMNNTSRNRYITINNDTKTLSEWIRYYKLKGSTVRQRYYVLGWNINKSLGLGD